MKKTATQICEEKHKKIISDKTIDIQVSTHSAVHQMLKFSNHLNISDIELSDLAQTIAKNTNIDQKLEIVNLLIADYPGIRIIETDRIPF